MPDSGAVVVAAAASFRAAVVDKGRPRPAWTAGERRRWVVEEEDWAFRARRADEADADGDRRDAVRKVLVVLLLPLRMAGVVDPEGLMLPLLPAAPAPPKSLPAREAASMLF